MQAPSKNLYWQKLLFDQEHFMVSRLLKLFDINKFSISQFELN